MCSSLLSLPLKPATSHFWSSSLTSTPQLAACGAPITLLHVEPCPAKRQSMLHEMYPRFVCQTVVTPISLERVAGVGPRFTKHLPSGSSSRTSIVTSPNCSNSCGVYRSGHGFSDGSGGAGGTDGADGAAIGGGTGGAGGPDGADGAGGSDGADGADGGADGGADVLASTTSSKGSSLDSSFVASERSP